MTVRPDTDSVINGLKDFQLATVEYVVERFYGPNPTRRFLVADEVGLGKTLVARGVIARTIDHLWDKVPQVDIIYICSNSDIARQNIQRLSIRDCEDVAQATRLTLLPLELRTQDESDTHKVRFVALTPGTSFEQSAGGGRVDERVLLYWLLDRAWGIHGQLSSFYVLREYASADNFKWRVENFASGRACGDVTIDERIATQFVSELSNRVAEDMRAGKQDLRSEFEALKKIFSRVNSRVPPEAIRRRTQWVGELRRLLAKVCLSALKPQLIIMDEFQRFRHLMDPETEPGELADQLFDSEAGRGARVLLLSATPYRSLSLHHENEDNHYLDFLKLIEFLEDASAAGLKELLSEYRAALPSILTPDGQARLRAAKHALEQRLSRVMTRTERLASRSDRGGMLRDAAPADLTLHSVDVRAYLGAQLISDTVGQGDVVEYWKSAPYLFNFMDTYVLKQAFTSTDKKREMMQLVRQRPETFLDFERARAYQPIEPANPRLRALLADTVERGMWRLLWIPPALGYYTPEGPFAAPELTKVTKQLVFSAWHIVPRAVASLLSHEAECRMMRAPDAGANVTQDDWRRQRGLLRFRMDGHRPAGMPLLLLVYPCLTFAQECDPRDLARETQISATEARYRLSERIRQLVTMLDIPHEQTGTVDERWYWLVPMLLDFANFPGTAPSWWERADLAEIWAGAGEDEEDTGWRNHVDQARQILISLQIGQNRPALPKDDLFAVLEHNRGDKLGRPPADLFDVLALAASAGPATAALRAFARIDKRNPAVDPSVMDFAAQTGRAFLTLFNHPEVISCVRAEFVGEPFWQRVLEYAHAGGLQAVLDEYVHLLKDSLGLAGTPIEERAEAFCAEIVSALTLRSASLRIDNITAPPYAREVKVITEPMRIRFAMRFGDDRHDEAEPGGADTVRKERVRAAFNSPFWPFVLVSTSVGQEGLDFHHYCHAVVHWNLPSNPVDLEQREGRVHRYKGHAVRKNVAAAHAGEACCHRDSDVWESVFSIARSTRPAQDNDLVPYWLYPGDAKIERHVPAIPYSREVERLHELRRALAIYRLVFGQSRQEDLIAYLVDKVPEEERDKIVAGLQLNLGPRTGSPEVKPQIPRAA